MTSDSYIIEETRNQVRWLWLNRPSMHNAFDAELIARLHAAIVRAGAEPGVRALVLSGRGKTFSAGADLNWMRAMAAADEAENRADAERLAALMRDLNFLGKPSIARVNGSAYGGGVGLVACCDIAIGHEDSKFTLSEVRLGLVPAVISPYVVAAIGVRAARRLFISGEIIDAAQAERLGLLHACVADDEALDQEVERCLHWLGKGGPIAQAEAKRLALAMAGMDRERQARIDARNAELIARLRVSDEGQHGIAAFLKKRPARWLRSAAETER